MKYANTHAIIIKRRNHREADRMLTLYTEDLGKVTALAKGIRKIDSKRKGQLELLNEINVQLVEGKLWYIVAQVELLESFRELKSSLETTQWAYYISEITEKIIPENEQNENLYKMLKKTYQFIQEYKSFDIVNAYNLKLLKMLGYYSDQEMKNYPVDMKDYLSALSKQTYEEILKQNVSNDLLINCHYLLKEKIEEVSELSIKTEITI